MVLKLFYFNFFTFYKFLCLLNLNSLPPPITKENTLGKPIDTTKAKEAVDNHLVVDNEIQKRRIKGMNWDISQREVRISALKVCLETNDRHLEKDLEEKFIKDIEERVKKLTAEIVEIQNRKQQLEKNTNPKTIESTTPTPTLQPTPFEPQIQKSTNPKNPDPTTPKIPQPVPMQHPRPQLEQAFQPQPGTKPTEPTIPQIPGNPTPTIPNNVFGVNFPQRYQQGQDNKGPRPIPNFKGENLISNPPHPTTNFTVEK